jgi:predicted dehydrogenase
MNRVLLVGAGPMAVAYAIVLKAQKIPFDVLGRGLVSANNFKVATGKEVYLKEEWKGQVYTHVIIAVGMEQLAAVAEQFILSNIPTVLIEKPAGLNSQQINHLANLAKVAKKWVGVAYNRRFYAATLEAEKRVKEDGGIVSAHFEFTEWSHVIQPLIKAPGVKENWFLGNSTHVVDLAYYFIGQPNQMSCYKSGQLDWHSAGAAFVGAGISEQGILFSYNANWSAPGRWGVELLTTKNRYYLRPMEKLQVQAIGSVAIQEIPILDQLDIDYKPGIYLQTEAFLKGETSRFPTIQQQAEASIKVYDKMMDALKFV